MEEGKHKSRREESEDSRKSHHRDKERNGEKRRDKRDRETRRSERDKSVNRDRETRRSERDKSVDRDREIRRSERDKSVDLDRATRRSERDKSVDKDRETRRSERDRSTDRDRETRCSERDKSVDKDQETRCSERDKSIDKDRETRRSERDRSTDRDWDAWHSERDKSVDKDRKTRRSERDRSVDSEGIYERERDKDKHRSRTKEKSRDRDDDRERGRDRKKDRDSREDRDSRGKEKRDKSKEREREKREDDRDSKDDRDRVKAKRDNRREREKDKREDRESEEDRDRVKVKRDKREDRESDRRDRGKERERERRIRDKEKRRDEVDSDENKGDDVRDRSRKRRDEVDSDENKGDDVRDRSRKRRKRDDDALKESSNTRSVREKSEDKNPAPEENPEDEQLKLDEEMEKRRRRVQEWQELKRKKEEVEREKLGETNAEEPMSGKTWTLEGESDDEEAPSPEKEAMDIVGDGEADQKTDDVKDGEGIDSVNGDPPVVLQEDDDIDPLDAFMNSMVLPEVEKLSDVLNSSTVDEKSSILNDVDEKKDVQSKSERRRKGSNKSMGRIIPGEDSDSDNADLDNNEDKSEDENDDEFIKRVKKTKAEKLSLVDHSKIDYQPFRKNFYIEVREIQRMTPEEVAAYRKELELKIHGKDVPKPVKTWHQTGLTSKILETIKKHNFEKPMPIQAQALPVIMNGRDCIGIAKTGSGKTLAFVLPMLRHIKDQPPVIAGDGPIGLIMAPTRELVQQIHSDIKKFSKVLGIRCVPVYGGSGVAQQISELKRGAEIVVCTPGRMIDILCTSGGKISNLRRVTYLVMDEADRMFDMGFEPQITRIVQNICPDRQTVLFSATFPRQVEILARKVLNKPVEIQVGGRSVVNKDIAQLVEIRPEKDRLLRLLELLGEWYEKGKILVFVQTQKICDELFSALISHGYPCLSLHGAKDQTDRESTISDFKSNVCNLMIATSIAARGLDVKDLELVINYDAPNHYEDYVHRVGRTGRAGRKGCSITFISEAEAKYAPDLVKALELSEQVVPDDLKKLAGGFMEKVNQGLERAHGTGYGGSGFKFTEEEDEARMAAKKAHAKEYGFEEDKSDSEDEDEGVRKSGGDISQQTALAQFAAIAAATKNATNVGPTSISAGQMVPNAGIPVSLPGFPVPAVPNVPGAGLPTDGAARAAALAAAMNLQHNLAKMQADAMPEHYEAELEINDFPQNARWKVTHKETLGPISDWTGAAITTRGQFYPQGKIAGPGERKLYLFIEGPTEQSVKRAKAELKRVLEDITNQALSLPGGTQPGKYSVF